LYRHLIRLLLALLLAGISICLQGCNTKPTSGYQGYAEGDFVFVAAPYAGRLEKRWVERGQKVTAGEPLFGLEHANEKADLAGYAARLKTAEARFENLSAGLVPSTTICEMLDAESGKALGKKQAMAYATRKGLVFLTGQDVLEAWQARIHVQPATSVAA